MKKLLFATMFFALSQQALALGATNCSSAQGNLKRVEKEVWGANLISWSFKKEQTDMNVLAAQMIDASKITLDTSEESDNPLETKTEIFAVQVELDYLGPNADPRVSFPIKTTLWVICHAWSNGAMD